MEVKQLSKLSAQETVVIEEQIFDIFFESSDKKDFRDEDHRLSFRGRWLDYYLEKARDLCFLAIEDDKLLGYLTGFHGAYSCLRIPGGELLEEFRGVYPSHLHINLHQDSRGKGIGSKLLDKFFVNCVESGSCGIHISTSPGKKNIGFYEKNGFKKLRVLEYKGFPMLVMGKLL